MAEYIEREQAIKIAESYGLKNGSALGRHSGIADCIAEAISVIPSAEVVTVRHGRWIMNKTSAGASYTVCSHCNASVKYNDEYGTVVMNLKGANYCPNCGAKMD